MREERSIPPEEHRFNEVNEEINERRAFLSEMRKMGALDKGQELDINNEIAERVSELNRLHLMLRE